MISTFFRNTHTPLRADSFNANQCLSLCILFDGGGRYGILTRLILFCRQSPRHSDNRPIEKPVYSWLSPQFLNTMACT